MPMLLNAISWLSALCVSLLVFLEPRKRARAYTAAWRLLHNEVGKFRQGEPGAPATALFEVIVSGEDLIARADG